MKRKARIFAALCVVAVGAQALYIYRAKTRLAPPPPERPDVPVLVPETPAQDPPVEQTVLPTSFPAATPASSPPAAAPAAAPVAAAPPAEVPPDRIFFRYNGVDSHYGKVAYVEPARSEKPNFVDQLSCEVVYVSADRGICLSADRGVLTTYAATLFDAGTFEKLSEFSLAGIPSRARVSRDAKLAALTVFVTGHGYSTLDFSTQTLIVDATSGKVHGDLETFAVTRDGMPFKEADFNFWGVTFTPDSKRFYATLSSGGQHFLVEGDVEGRSAKVIHANVECPSLSPDGTRVAYKKRFKVGDRIEWQLHVLDLASGKETPLSEKRSVDDQLEWLDNATVLYTVPVRDDSPSTNVWLAAADGSRKPRLYLRTAYSPAAVR
jgi:hypothetical protein